jgi:hypothetical protein
MASGEALFEKIKATPHGHGQGDFFRVLAYYGFRHVRDARHGGIFRHDQLSDHPDPSVRQLMIPRGTDLPPYVARKVVRAIEALPKP